MLRWPRINRNYRRNGPNCAKCITHTLTYHRVGRQTEPTHTLARTEFLFNFKCNLMVIYANEIRVCELWISDSLYENIQDKPLINNQNTRRMVEVGRDMAQTESAWVKKRERAGGRERGRTYIGSNHKTRNATNCRFQKDREFGISSAFFPVYHSIFCNMRQLEGNAACMKPKIG